MTLDQAIADAEKASNSEEYKQLAEWLKELKLLRDRIEIRHELCEGAVPEPYEERRTAHMIEEVDNDKP